MYTKREAAQQLGIDRNTLTKWARDCGIRDGEDPRDKRLSLLSDEDLRTIRERYADRHTFSASSAHRPQNASVSSADLAARVAVLEQQVAALLARYSDNLTVASAHYPYEPARRVAVTTAREGRTPARPAIPPHLMSFPTWAKRHSVKIGTVKTWRDKRYLPVERGQWLEDGVRIDTALTIEGREVAHQLARLPWPCERCSMVEGEEGENEQTEAATL